MRYEHTQHAPLYLILVGLGGVTLTSAWLTPVPAVRLVLAVSGGLVHLLAFSFRRLTVRDEGDRLLIEFGPLPLFRRHFPYSEIGSAERGRTMMLDGWGIHYLPRRGATWSLWGFDCVILRLAGGKTLRVGTDDPEGLSAFLGDCVRRESQGRR